MTAAVTWTLVWITLGSAWLPTATDHIEGFGAEIFCKQAEALLKEKVGPGKLITGCIPVNKQAPHP